MTQAERQVLAERMDRYTVYNNTTHAVIMTGTFNDVEEYITNKQYTVVHDYSGYTVSEQYPLTTHSFPSWPVGQTLEKKVVETLKKLLTKDSCNAIIKTQRERHKAKSKGDTHNEEHHDRS